MVRNLENSIRKKIKITPNSAIQKYTLNMAGSFYRIVF